MPEYKFSEFRGVDCVTGNKRNAERGVEGEGEGVGSGQ